MTLHAFDKTTNKSMKWVALPLEFVDWMAANFDGTLIRHLRQIDPYASVRIPDNVTDSAVREFIQVRDGLEANVLLDIPNVVDLFGTYGRAGALTTIKQLVDFFKFASENSCKIVSIGD